MPKRPDQTAQLRRRQYVDRHVGRRLIAARAVRGWSADELSRRVQITSAELDTFEAGDRRIPPMVLTALATVLDVELSHFFEGLAGL
jgi:transcriptional regulator with XRE-family HTH domain